MCCEETRTTSVTSLRRRYYCPCLTYFFQMFPFFPLTHFSPVSHFCTLWKRQNVFRNEILKFIRPSSNSFYNCHNPIGVIYITRIRLGLSHLREHKFKHSFQDSISPICNCGNDVESPIHFFLLNSLSKIDHKLLVPTLPWRKYCYLETHPLLQITTQN